MTKLISNIAAFFILNCLLWLLWLYVAPILWPTAPSTLLGISLLDFIACLFTLKMFYLWITYTK